MSQSIEPQTLGIHHLGLTVPSLDQATAFFTDALGFKLAGEIPEYPAKFVSDDTVMLTLWQAKIPEPNAFNRQENIGLHHFALKVASPYALEDIFERVRAYPDVEIEFSPEALTGIPAKHMMCLIPGGIRMEIIAAT